MNDEPNLAVSYDLQTTIRLLASCKFKLQREWVESNS